jgi:hypothetical protein
MMLRKVLKGEERVEGVLDRTQTSGGGKYPR